jgi:CheY-like chemotaxis protein
MPPEPVTVYVDHLRMAQVLANLLNNAAKYSEASGTIRLVVAIDAGVLRMSVRDSGVGIPPEMIGRVFDLFAQSDRSVGRAHGGLGIGLTLARSLVELHGGRIEARSEGPGKGSEFVVTLPLVAPPEARAAERPAARHEAASGRRVLVADDNQDAAATLALALQSLGHIVETASDGLEAIELAQRFKPSVMFLDLGMPGLTGFDVARRVRAGSWAEVPALIAVTGWGQADDKQRSREAGFDMHLVKPIDLATLETVLTTLDRSPRQPSSPSSA